MSEKSGIKVQNAKDKKGTFKRLFSYLGRSKFRLVFSIVMTIIATASSLGGAYLLKPIIDDYVVPGDWAGLIKMLIILGVVYLIGVFATFLQSQVMVRVAQGTVKDIRSDLFAKLQKLPISFFDKRAHGDIMSLLTNDMDMLQTALEQTIIQVISNVLQFVGMIVLMFILSPLLFLITLVMMIVMIVIANQISKRSRKYFVEQQQDIADMNGYIEEMIEGQKVIKVFSREEITKEDFAKIDERYRHSSTLAQTFGGIIMPIMNNLNNINYALISMVGGLLAIFGGFKLGSLIAYLRYTRNFAQPIQQVTMQIGNVMAALAGAERIFDTMDEYEEIDEGKVTLVSAKRTRDGKLVPTYLDWETAEYIEFWLWRKINSDGTEEFIPLEGDVRFHDVIFGYEPNKTILKDISLFAKPGQKIAFVGSTGAGKTTITNLINRFYEINEGTITYDGIDVRDIKKDDLRHSLGMVLQDTQLFTGTIRENIRYGRLGAVDEEIEAAARISNAAAFIKHLPHGYDTVITRNGENLSQGQRQLLSIARTAIANPPVLILDEATSSIDTRTEKQISQGMDALMQGRTVFVIAHRLSTVRDSKAIMVLEQGEIIERGSHDSLMEEKGKYYELNVGLAELA